MANISLKTLTFPELDDTYTIPQVDNTLTTAGDAADAKKTGDEINQIKADLGDVGDMLFNSSAVDINSSSFYGFIKEDGTWNANSSGRSSAVTIPIGAKSVEIKANAEASARVAFLKSKQRTDGQMMDFADGASLVVIPVEDTRILNIPEDAVYFYLRTKYGEYNNVPEVANWRFSAISQASNALGLHEESLTMSQINVVKRCRQWTDIKWTPAVDLARLMLVQRSPDAPSTAQDEYYMALFKAGVEYKGMPYGRVRNTMDGYGYNYSTVGRYIDFATFISSVVNSKSLLCQNDVSNLSDRRSIRYAGVCSGLASYAYGVEEVNTSSVKSISGMFLIGKINDNGTHLDDVKFKIGDLLDVYGHVAVITDIIRDANGMIQNIEVSESTPIGLADKNYTAGLVGGVARRKGWTRSDLFDGRWAKYTVYRYSGNVDYVPTPYVSVGNEFNAYCVEHFPIMPYEGEGFVYKSGYIPNSAVKLVYTLNDYAYVKVFKDGSEISGSPFALTEGADSIDIDTITAGDYTAYLCNIDNGDVVNLTYPCHWSIE